MKTPLRLVMSEDRPFRIYMLDGDGLVISDFERIAHSSQQNTLADVRAAVGFTGEGRAEVMKLVADQEDALRQIVQAVNSFEPLVAALRTVAALGGNLPDDAYENRGGPNDAKHRGILYCGARQIARKALATLAESENKPL